jgi:hypothetical protein
LAVTLRGSRHDIYLFGARTGGSFDLKPDGNDTTLLFAHRSFKNADDEYANATTRWGY